VNSNNDSLVALILQSIREACQQLDLQQLVELTAGTVLFGPGGELDSLGLVNLIVLLEEKISDEFGVEIVLTDQRAMSQQHSPFRTVQVLADYVVRLLNEKKGV